MRSNQFIRTDQAIISAFLRLLRKIPFEKLTVQDILDATPINRSNFYKHFHDKYEIAEKLQEELLELIKGSGLSMGKDIVLGVKHTGSDFTELIRDKREAFLALTEIKTESVDILGKLTELFKSRYLEMQGRESSPALRELESELYAGLIVRFIVYSIRNEVSFDSILPDFNTAWTNVFLSLLSLNREATEDVKASIRKARIKTYGPRG